MVNFVEPDDLLLSQDEEVGVNEFKGWKEERSEKGPKK